MLSAKKDAIDAMLIMNDKKHGGHQSNYNQISRIMLVGGENFKNYCNNLSINGTKALIPCGSADQSLELVYRGFDEIQVFDINKLSKYILNIKIAAILSLTYEEYIKFITTLFEDINITSKIFYLLDDDTKEFLNILLANNSNYVVRNSLFTHTCMSTDALKYYKNNFSIYNEKDYYKIKKRLVNTQIKFREMNLHKPFLKDNYDFIYFSNILLFSSSQEIKKFIEDELPIYMRHLNNEGMIGLHYAHLFANEPLEGYNYTINDKKAHKKNVEILKKLFEYKTINTIVDSSGFGMGLGQKDMIVSLKK